MTRKKKRIPLIVLSSLFILMIACAIWQWNNLEALMLYGKYSKNEIEKKLAAEKTESVNAISKLTGSINDLTEDEKKMLNNGIITQAEALKLIIERSESNENSDLPGSFNHLENTGEPSAGDSDVVGSDVGQKSGSATVLPDKSIVEASDDEQHIKELVAQLFILRATYTNNLDKLVTQAKSEYLALPASERNSTGKKKILLKYLGQASTMESSCDASVNGLIAELSPLLQKTGGDSSLIDEIKKTYKQEKSLKKANYMALFGKI